MPSKYLVIIVVAAVVIAGGIFIMSRSEVQPPTSARQTEAPSGGRPVPGTNTPELVVENEAPAPAGQVKEFTMRSWYSPEDKKPYFSLQEMVVNQGDTVRVKVTNTFGTHNIKLDEYNVFAETPLNQEVVVEFVADKVGNFVYYCSKPGHRAAGQWGTLRVLASLD